MKKSTKQLLMVAGAIAGIVYLKRQSDAKAAAAAPPDPPTMPPPTSGYELATPDANYGGQWDALR